VPPQDTHPGWLCKHFCFRGLSEDESFLVFRREAAHKAQFRVRAGLPIPSSQTHSNWWFAGTLPFADGSFHHADDGALVVPFVRSDATRTRAGWTDIFIWRASLSAETRRRTHSGPGHGRLLATRRLRWPLPGQSTVESPQSRNRYPHSHTPHTLVGRDCAVVHGWYSNFKLAVRLSAK
jgi:hypothetical protein